MKVDRKTPLEVQIGEILRTRHLTLTLAESCTGGLVSHRITNVSGASGYFLGGIVSYDNTAKINLLGVSQSTLDAHGAVSRDAVIEMARGARIAFRADIAASISGIAGPGGGTATKPVGTVWIGLAAQGKESADEFHFSGGREDIKWASADAALRIILDYLKQ